MSKASHIHHVSGPLRTTATHFAHQHDTVIQHLNLICAKLRIVSTYALLLATMFCGLLTCLHLRSLVIIRDLPAASRRDRGSDVRVFSNQTLNGEILQSVRSLGDEANKVLTTRGNVLACRARSREEVEKELKRHPYAAVSVFPHYYDYVYHVVYPQ